MNQATLDLAIRCIDYLCQNHHDPVLSEQEVSSKLLTGQYSFDAFASQMWFELSCQYLRSVKALDVSAALTESIHMLWELRKKEDIHEGNSFVSDEGDSSDVSYVNDNKTDDRRVPETIKHQHPLLHDLLRSVSHFRQSSFVYTGEADHGISNTF